MFTNYFKKRNIFKKTIALITPKKFNKGITGIINESSKKLKNYSHAKLLESFIIAVICGIGFSIAGLKGWLLFAIICGILNIIPYIGPWMGAVGPILVSLLDPSISTFIITAITMIIAQTIDSFYIIPFMIPKQLKINPLVSIILIIIAAKLFGPLGMLMAIPIYAIYVVILEGTYRELVKIHDPKHYKKVFNKK